MSWEVIEKIEYSYKNSSNKIKKEPDVIDDDTKKTATWINDALYDAVEDDVRDLKILIDEEMAKVKDLKNMANKIKVRTYC